MKEGLLGRKIGMTRIFVGNEVVPVTAVQAGPCPVLKVMEKKGKRVVQLGFQEIKLHRLPSPQRGYYKKNNMPPMKFVKEFVTSQEVKPGDAVRATIFSRGEKVDVRGKTIGKGFQGVMKRFHYKGGPASHGSMTHRRLQSAGDTNPARVHKGKGMPGRHGGKWVTNQNLLVAEVLEEKNILLLKGAVPGKKGGLLYICKK